MNSWKYELYQVDKLAYNSLFLFHTFLEKFYMYMEDQEVWLLHIQM